MQAVSKHSRTSPEENMDLLLVVAYIMLNNPHLAQVCFGTSVPNSYPIWRKFVITGL